MPSQYDTITPWPALIKMNIFSCECLNIMYGQPCEIKCCNIYLNQVCTGLRPVRAWFHKIDSVQIIGTHVCVCVYVCVCVCVCVFVCVCVCMCACTLYLTMICIKLHMQLCNKLYVFFFKGADKVLHSKQLIYVN